MNKLMIAAMSSGSGKTTVLCALIAALKKRGFKVTSFKCGPDYIDPMFHRSVMEVESHNLDLFLSDEDCVKDLFNKYSAGYDTAVVEGVMGYFDGLGGISDRVSTWHIADTLDIPAILVVRPKGISLTLSAQIKGLCSFRNSHHIAGIILNDCSDMLYKSLAPMLERESGLPVLGYMPHIKDAEFESRHLGLYTADEIVDINKKIDILANQLEKTVDINRLMELSVYEEKTKIKNEEDVYKTVRLAVSKDEAFSFVYAETLDEFKKAGAEIVFFSPLHDNELPESIDGLYLTGGYPELYAKKLAENKSMRISVQKAVKNGLPTVAECGGFLYLCRTLEDMDGNDFPMADVLTTNGFRTERLVRFGYSYLTAKENSMLFKKGETVPVHEFHYWDTVDKGNAFISKKPVSGKAWQSGFANDSLYAAFAHLYFAGNKKLAHRFIDAMKKRKHYEI